MLIEVAPRRFEWVVDGEAVGSFELRDGIELRAVQVRPDRRGRGVGRAMLAALDLGLVWAETDRDAVDFYRRCGFSVVSLGEKYPGVERFRCTRARSAWWLHPAAEVRPSPIEGTGLFASSSIDEGEVVVRLGGRLVDTAALDALLSGAGGYVDTVAVGGGLHVVLPDGTPVHHGNHSCDPTLRWSDPLTLVAARPVVRGEELTLDYGPASGPGFEMACRCGAPTCRGVVVGTAE